MARNVIVVATEGESVGQVNGLSVIRPRRHGLRPAVADHRDAWASAARASLDLQREAQLSGPIHSKAVLTLQGFLVDRYADDAPLTLAARLSFEQSYGMIEGDSATVRRDAARCSRASPTCR